MCKIRRALHYFWVEHAETVCSLCIIFAFILGAILGGLYVAS